MFKILIYTTSIVLVIFTTIAVVEDMNLFAFFGVIFTPVWFTMLYLLHCEDKEWMSK